MFWENMQQTIELTAGFILQYTGFVLLWPFYLLGMMAEIWSQASYEL